MTHLDSDEHMYDPGVQPTQNISRFLVLLFKVTNKESETGCVLFSEASHFECLWSCLFVLLPLLFASLRESGRGPQRHD